MLVPVVWIPITMIVGMIVGWIGGKYHERSEWSALINEGLLPKPKGRLN